MSRVIDAVLQLRDKFSAPMRKSLDLMVDMGREGNKTRKSIEQFGKGVETVGKNMTAAITLPIAGMAATSYKSFESVNKSLQLTKETMGDAKWAAGDLKGALEEAATNSIYSMDEAASAMVNFARQGWDAKQTADMLAPAMNLAAGTATEMSIVTSGLGNTLKAFDATSAEATRYADMFTVAQAQANTNVEQLIESMSIAGPIAKTVGWGFEDIATLIGVFGDASIDASEGANALKTGLARLSGGNSTANKALDRLGISLYDDAGNMKDMVDVIGTLQGAFAGMTQEEQMFNASQLFGQNQMSKWLALINGPGVSTLQDLRDNISDAGGQAANSANAMMTPLEKLSSTFDVFKFSVGEAVAESVVPMIEKATELVDRFRKLSPEQKKQIINFAKIAAIIGPVLMVAGKMITVFGSVAKVFGMVSKAGGVLKFAIAGLTSPLGVVAAAVAAVIAVVAIVVTHFDKFKEAASGAMDRVRPAVEHFQGAIEKLWGVVGPIFSAIGEMVASDLVRAFQLLIDIATPLIDGLATVIEGISDTIQGVIDFATSIAEGDWSSAFNSLGDIAGGVFETMKGIIDGVVGAINGIVDATRKAGDALAEHIGTGAAWTGEGSAVNRVRAHASGTPHFEGGWTRINEKGGEIVNLPNGTQIIPHEASLNKQISGGVSIAKLADQIVVREDADIDRIASAIVQKVKQASSNRGGWTYNGNMA